MPFVRTYVHENTSQMHRQQIVEGIHWALVDSIGMPESELFNLVSEYRSEQFFYDRTFNGIARSERLVVVEITLRRGRSDAMKRDLYAAIAHNLEHRCGMSTQDVFIFMHENDYSDWSVGNGVFAMALVQQVGNDG
jgi:phenylpyruvate tautomerase PptA (4-oxalocrotonate tautomerase family)